MTEQKYTLILLLVGCFVLSATACSTTEISNCRSESGINRDYGHPVLLLVLEAENEDFCEKIDNFTTCLDEFRAECSFDEMEEYSSFERMGIFICGDTTRYYEFFDVISNLTHRNAWEECFDTFDLDGTEPSEEGCGELNTLVQCQLDEITEERAEAQAYVEEFGDAALTDYYSHYSCPSGSSTVGITSSLVILSLLAYLWSTFH